MDKDTQFNDFSRRLEEAFIKKGIKQVMLVKKYDYLSSALINKFFKTQKTITEQFARLCYDENINIDWICTGRGDKFISDSLNSKDNKLYTDKEIEILKAYRNLDEDYKIKFYGQIISDSATKRIKEKESINLIADKN